jgi:hypothetical protein
MFSLDLVAAADEHVRFLRRVHAAGLSLRAPSAAEFRRYGHLWLPLLKAAAPDAALCPPLDVAWLWHCHRLAPASYARACLEILGATHALDCPACAFRAAEANSSCPLDDADVKATRALWETRYPDEPFFLEPKGVAVASTGAQWASETHGRTFGVLSGFDVVESCERQASFLWQVSGARFSDPAFLREGVLNYARFLRLMKLFPAAFVVPTYQIDLMWHTHMLASSAAYHRDGAALTGQRAGPDHDDSVNDRSHPETKLNVCTTTTKQLWQQAFGREYTCRGGMFRGDPPRAYWHRAWQPCVEDDGAAAEAAVVCQQPVSMGALLFDALAHGAAPATCPVGGAPGTPLTDTVAAAEAAAVAATMQVAVPATALPGAMVQFQTPDGQTVAFVVPPGVAPGAVVTVALPAAKSPTVVPGTAVGQATLEADGKVYGSDSAWLQQQPLFVAAAAKSRKRHVNANPQRPGYVFGAAVVGSAFAGYWRLDTPQADAIIVRKLMGRLAPLERSARQREQALASIPTEVQPPPPPPLHRIMLWCFIYIFFFSVCPLD